MPKRITGIQGSGRGRGPGRGRRGGGGGLGIGRVLIDVDADDLSPANSAAEYAEDKMEAAIMLRGFNEMKAADPEKVDGQPSKRDQLADILADRINKIPFYQKNFGIGGDSGRKVIGFFEVADQDKLPDNVRKALPPDAVVPIIANDNTESIGPMTEKASADPDDAVQYFTLSQLANMAS